MALSQAQNDFIVARSNARGAVNSVKAHYTSHVLDGASGGFLTITMVSDTDPDEVHSGTRRGTAATEQPDVTDEFKELVNRVLTQALRPF